MAKKISERERLLAYSYTASKEELEEALKLFRTALKVRFTASGARKRGGARDGGKQGVKNTTATGVGAGAGNLANSD